MFREIAGAVGFVRTRYKNIIAGEPEQMAGGFVKLKALEQKDDLHAFGMDMGCRGASALPDVWIPKDASHGSCVCAEVSILRWGVQQGSSIKVFIASPLHIKQADTCKTYKFVSDIFLNAG
ncbi:MAG: hypothetical protein ACLRPR_09325 [Eisenbergiella sp.]